MILPDRQDAFFLHLAQFPGQGASVYAEVGCHLLTGIVEVDGVGILFFLLVIEVDQDSFPQA